MSPLDIQQTVTLSLFRLDTLSSKWWAFSMMQLGHRKLQHVEGLNFYKLMGTGKSFNWPPDFSSYAFLGCWESENHAQEFFNNHPFFRAYQSRSREVFTLFLKPVSAHGSWSGQSPFQQDQTLKLEGPVAVLTRASISKQRLGAFWKSVPKVNREIACQENCLLAVGIGEWPVVQQATFSLWTSLEAMTDFAYRGKAHADVLKASRKGWFKEELFARFYPYDSCGSWNGNDPLARYHSQSGVSK